jgi:hypothetical protein
MFMVRKGASKVSFRIGKLTIVGSTKQDNTVSTNPIVKSATVIKNNSECHDKTAYPIHTSLARRDTQHRVDKFRTLSRPLHEGREARVDK